jgi:hypothetical protein
MDIVTTGSGTYMTAPRSINLLDVGDFFVDRDKDGAMGLEILGKSLLATDTYLLHVRFDRFTDEPEDSEHTIFIEAGTLVPWIHGKAVNR